MFKRHVGWLLVILLPLLVLFWLRVLCFGLSGKLLNYLAFNTFSSGRVFPCRYLSSEVVQCRFLRFTLQMLLFCLEFSLFLSVFFGVLQKP